MLYRGTSLQRHDFIEVYNANVDESLNVEIEIAVLLKQRAVLVFYMI